MAKMPIPIDRDELQRLYRDEQAQLVEVLPPDEFEDEHLPNAINIPLTTLDRESAAALDLGRPVVVYCYDRPSARLAEVAQEMRDDELTRVIVTRSDGVLAGVVRRTDVDAEARRDS